MNTPNGLRKGQAFREYLAVQDQVQEMASKGFDLTHIHRSLVDAERITMSYKSLYYHIYGKQRRRKSRLESPIIQPASQPQAQVPRESKVAAPARLAPQAQVPAVFVPVNTSSEESEKKPAPFQASVNECVRKVDKYLNTIPSSNPELQQRGQVLAFGADQGV